MGDRQEPKQEVEQEMVAEKLLMGGRNVAKQVTKQEADKVMVENRIIDKQGTKQGTEKEAEKVLEEGGIAANREAEQGTGKSIVGCVGGRIGAKQEA